MPKRRHFFHIEGSNLAGTRRCFWCGKLTSQEDRKDFVGDDGAEKPCCKKCYKILLGKEG